MVGDKSEQMMALLKELSLLKELDSAFEPNPDKSAADEYVVRQRRREEIAQEMKDLAKEKQDDDREQRQDTLTSDR